MLAVATLALLVASTARGDVTDYLGRAVTAVALVVDGHPTTDPTLQSLVEVHVGQPLSMRDVRETVLHLFALGRFEDVRVDAMRQPPGDGVTVRFDLTPLRPVDAIEFVGDIKEPGIKEDELRRTVTDRAGPSPPVTRIDELSSLLETTLRTRGYLRARVTGRAVPHGAAHTALEFTVSPGARTLIGMVTVDAPEAAKAAFLADVQATSGAPFEREALLARVDKYLRNRRAQGFYEAKASMNEDPADNDRVMNLTFVVDPGRHVRIVFTGDPVPGDKKELVPVEREGSVDEDLLEDATARIEDALKAQGYKDAMAPHQRSESNGELVITFHVTRGQQYRVGAVMFAGNTSLSLIDLQPALRLRPGQPFSQAALDAEAGTIEDVYRRSGFGSARVEPNVVPEQQTSGGAIPMDITFAITEGVRTVVGTVTVTGNMSIPTSTLLSGLRLQPGRPFVVASLAADRDDILARYQNAGYENATVEAVPQATRPSGAQSIVENITYQVREGPQVLVDHVLIIGPEHTDRSIVEKQLQLHAGDPLSRDAVLDTQRRLQSLGLYRSVTVSELRHGEDNRRDLLVSVEEGPSRSVAYGGGFELARRVEASDTGAGQERIDAAPRGSFQITWRNLFGTNRSASLFSSLTLHPQGTAQQGTTEYRIVNTYRAPRVFDAPVDGLVTLTLEQQWRSSFSFRRRSATAEATHRFSRSVSIIGTYQIQKTDVYNQNVDPADQNAIDRVFPNVRLSSFSGSLLRDTRNDQLDPTTGEYFSAYGQLAARALGGEVGFVKTFFRASAFRQIPGSRGVVLAGNAFLGLAHGFPQQNPDGSIIVDANGQPVVDLPQSERFYAGGDTTMRGFALDQLGVRHIPPQSSDTIDVNGFPLGGNSEVLFNGEVRVPVWRQIEVHGFVDTGNVFKRTVDLDLGELRTAVGFGFLYKSPVGPLRFDVGFKVNPLPDESLTAFFITFGRAF